MTLEDRPNLFGQHAFWLIDGAPVPHVTGRGLSFFGTPTTSRIARAKPFGIGSQELTSVAERLADLDRFGIDCQIATTSPDHSPPPCVYGRDASRSRARRRRAP